MYQKADRVMVFMLQETTIKDMIRSGPYRILEVQLNCLQVQPVDRPS